MPNKVERRGGVRKGAGRPKGSRMRRSDALAESLISAGKCPVEALVRLAEQAERDGEVAQAVGAWKSVLPYIYPKPKAVEFEPMQVVNLAREIASVRAEAVQPDDNRSYAERLELALSKLDREEN